MYRVCDATLHDYDDKQDYATQAEAEAAARDESLSDRVIAVIDLSTAEGDSAGDIVVLVLYGVVYRAEE